MIIVQGMRYGRDLFAGSAAWVKHGVGDVLIWEVRAGSASVRDNRQTPLQLRSIPIGSHSRPNVHFAQLPGRAVTTARNQKRSAGALLVRESDAVYLFRPLG